jgi:hypothetical protein
MRNGIQPPRHSLGIARDPELVEGQDTKNNGQLSILDGSLSPTERCSPRIEPDVDGCALVWGLRAVFVLALLGVIGCQAYRDLPSADQPLACPPVIVAGAERGWEPAVPLNGWRYIVVHHSATVGGSAALFEKEHREQRHWENGMGYHFVIGNGVDVPDGLVEIGDRWRRQIQGAHVGGDLNKECIGVCLVGDFERTYPTARQMASLDRLLRFLQARCRIPTTRVLGHREVRPGHTVCPGQHFSMDALRRSLSGSPAWQAPVEPATATTPATGAPPPPLPGAVPGPQSFRIYGSVRNLR